MGPGDTLPGVQHSSVLKKYFPRTLFLNNSKVAKVSREPQSCLLREQTRLRTSSFLPLARRIFSPPALQTNCPSINRFFLEEHTEGDALWGGHRKEARPPLTPEGALRRIFCDDQNAPRVSHLMDSHKPHKIQLFSPRG